MIPLYVPKWVEEIARAVGVAVGAYLVTAISTSGFPTTQQAVIALLAGAVPIAWAAVRTWLNKTPLTPTEPPPLGTADTTTQTTTTTTTPPTPPVTGP